MGILEFFQLHEIHESTDSLKSGTKELVEDQLVDDEEFILAVDCADESNFAMNWDWSTVLVITDQRALACKKKPVKEWVESYSIDKISSVEYEKSWFKAEITIKGSGDIDESFEVYKYKPFAERFVSALQGQFNSQ